MSDGGAALTAVNPFTPPKAAVDDIAPTRAVSIPRIWSWRGRIGRLRYMSYMLVGLAITFLLFVPAVGVFVLLRVPLEWATTLGYAIAAPTLILSTLCGVQRAHDMGWSGWWSIVVVAVPFAGLVWLIKPGMPEANRFGDPPAPNGPGVVIGAIVFGVFVVSMSGLGAAEWLRTGGAMPDTSAQSASRP